MPSSKTTYSKNILTSSVTMVTAFVVIVVLIGLIIFFLVMNLPKSAIVAGVSSYPISFPASAPVSNNVSKVASIIRLKSCESSNLNLEMFIPISWSCRVTSDFGGRSNDMIINSGFFNIAINDHSTSNPCDAGCGNVGEFTQKIFYKSNILVLGFYRFKDPKRGGPSEIIGDFKNNPLPTKGEYNDSMVITYLDIINKDLTSAQYNELKSVLDSISYLKNDLGAKWIKEDFKSNDQVVWRIEHPVNWQANINAAALDEGGLDAVNTFYNKQYDVNFAFPLLTDYYLAGKVLNSVDDWVNVDLSKVDPYTTHKPIQIVNKDRDGFAIREVIINYPSPIYDISTNKTNVGYYCALYIWKEGKNASYRMITVTPKDQNEDINIARLALERYLQGLDLNAGI